MKLVQQPQLKLRSIFTSGLNLGGQVHKTRRGKGSYVRKDRYNRWS
jgi:stalled ribosome alternative rescue factor ArfA